ncbi:MAG: hypothetical protein WAL71_19835 [Terriglobales bacterium]
MIEKHVDVFKEKATGDATDSVGSFDEVVTGLAGMFAAERIREDEGLGELAGAHEESRAINVPSTLFIHDFSPLESFRLGLLFVLCRDSTRRRKTSQLHMIGAAVEFVDGMENDFWG